MKITILERLVIGHFLPQAGTIHEQMIVKSILDKAKLTEEEMKKAYVPVNGKLAITEDSNFETEIELKSDEIALLMIGLKACDEQKLITQQNLSLALKLQNHGNF